MVLQEADVADMGNAFSLALGLVRKYPEAAIWIEREVNGEPYMLAILQGEEGDIDE